MPVREFRCVCGGHNQRVYGIQPAHGWSPVQKANILVEGSKGSEIPLVRIQSAQGWWWSIGKTIVHGSVQVERHVSKSCE
ncbi:hypothetical protein [Nitrosomonas marina]|uniref:hypothetical protein n=1 Tax=Nitrosomonas marina TaxID=917 RepID=UPI00115FC40A|nr:hypothetical protein [Nitrosomonas marina]